MLQAVTRLKLALILRRIGWYSTASSVAKADRVHLSRSDSRAPTRRRRAWIARLPLAAVDQPSVVTVLVRKRTSREMFRVGA